MKKEPNITERQAREIVEKMGRREPYTSKSIDDFYWSIGLEPEEPEQSGKTVTEEAEIPMVDEPLEVATGKRQYRRSASAANSAGCLWMSTAPLISKFPKLSTASPCSSVRRCVTSWTGLSATSEEGHERIGLIENLVRLHLEVYRNDIEQWRKL